MGMYVYAFVGAKALQVKLVLKCGTSQREQKDYVAAEIVAYDFLLVYYRCGLPWDRIYENMF